MKLPQRWFGKNRIWLRLERLEDRNAPSDTLSAIREALGLDAVAEQLSVAAKAAVDSVSWGVTTSDDPLTTVSIARPIPATTDMTHWVPRTPFEQAASQEDDGAPSTRSSENPAAPKPSTPVKETPPAAKSPFFEQIDDDLDEPDLFSIPIDSGGGIGGNFPISHASAADNGGATGASSSPAPSAAPIVSPSGAPAPVTPSANDFTPPFIPSSGNANAPSGAKTPPSNSGSSSSPSNGNSSGQSDGQNTDPFSFSSATYQAYENQGFVTINVLRSGPVNQAVSVDYATSNGTATAGVDYVGTSGTLTFQSGAKLQTFNISILNDGASDGGETVTLTLSNPQGASIIGPNPATLTIYDTTAPQPTVQFYQSQVVAYDDTGSATVEVDRTGDTSQVASVDYATSDGTATAGEDYTATNGTLVFSPGATQEFLTVPILNDGPQPEDPETVTLTLSNAQGATINGVNPTTLTICDPPPPATLQFVTDSFGAFEDQGSATIDVVRQGDTRYASTVDFTTTDGTAFAGLDYAANSGTLYFAPGQADASFNVAILSDTPGDGPESLSLILSNVQGAALVGADPATLTINDPAPPQVMFAGDSFSTYEDQGFATITVARDGDLSGSTTAAYATTDGSAIAGTDYGAANGNLWFGPGDTDQSFVVPIFNDGQADGPETVNLTLSNSQNGTITDPNPVVLTINDVPAPAVFQFDSSAYTASEGDGQATLTVTRTGDARSTGTVDYSTADVTAIAGLDYAATRGTLTFQPGQTAATIAVNLSVDGPADGPESLSLTLSNPENGTIGPTSTALLTITDALPYASDYSFSTTHDQAINATTGALLGDAYDPYGLPLTAVLDNGPANGTVTVGSDGSFTYTPDTQYVGSDSFTYHVNDGYGNSNTATVSLQVTNTAPMANDDHYGTPVNTALNVNAELGLLANDYDADGDPLQITAATGPANGQLTWSSDGSFQYVPNLGFNGTDAFTYTISDGIASASATVTINVYAVISPPVGVDDHYGTQANTTLTVPPQGVLQNDYNPNGAPLTAIKLTDTANGTLQYFNPDGSFQYTPNGGFTGADSFTYAVTNGYASFAPVNVFIDVFNITDVKFLTTAESGGATKGDLSHDNPDGGDYPDFQGGDRFFPDAASYTSNNTSRNIVRVRATLSPGTPVGTLVYFRSFDVDDPSSDLLIDPNDVGGAKGMDNRGWVDPADPTKEGQAPLNQPNAISKYRGRLRSVDADGNATGNFAQEGAVVSAPVRQLGNDLVAEVDLATSFAAGDNFRVLASLSPNAFAGLNDTTSVPTSGTVPGFDGVASPQLSVWRHVHVETDKMAPIKPRAYLDGKITRIVTPASAANGWRLRVEVNYGGLAIGDLQGGNLWSADGRRFMIIGNATSASGKTILDLYTPPATGAAPPTGPAVIYIGDCQDVPITGVAPVAGGFAVTVADKLALANEYQGGFLHTPTIDYPIVSNTAGVPGGNTVTITLPPGVAGPPAPGVVTLYQDDFQAAGILRINPNNDAHLYDMMDNSTVLDANKFAAAYIEPEYTDLQPFATAAVTATPHIRNENEGLRDAFESSRQSAPYESNLYWAVYVSTAFEGDYENSNDPFMNKLLLGVTEGDQKQISAIFLETIHDVFLTPPPPRPGDPPPLGLTEGDIRARVTVHEVGHQFGLAFGVPPADPGFPSHRNIPPNIMSTRQSIVPPADYVFYSTDIAHMRDRISSPGPGN
jgi:hypothetical protein